MLKKKELNFYDITPELFHRMQMQGVLCTVCDRQGTQNLLTIGWGQVGPQYHLCNCRYSPAVFVPVS